MTAKSRQSVKLDTEKPRLLSVKVDSPEVVHPVRPGGFIQQKTLRTGRDAPVRTPGAASRVREGNLVRAARGGHQGVPAHLKNGGATVPLISKNDNTMQVLNALSGLAPGLRNTYDSMLASQQKESSSLAQRDYMLNGADQNLSDIEKFLQDKDEVYQKSYKALHGKVTGDRAAEDLLSTYERNRGSITDEESFNKLMKDKAEQYVKDVDDENFLKNFLPAFESGTQKVYSEFKKDSDTRLIEGTRDEVYSSQVADIRNTAAKGGTIDDIVNGLKQYEVSQASGKLLMTSGDVRQSAFEAVINVARESENPNLLTVLDKMGYTDDPEYHERVLRAKDQVGRAIKTRQAAVSGVDKLHSLTNLKTQAQRGELTQQALEFAVTNRYISPEAASSLLLVSQQKQIEVRQKEIRKNMILSGDIPLAKANFSKAEFTEGLEEAVSYMEAQVKAGEMDAKAGMVTLLNMSAQAGQLPKAWKAELNNSSLGSQAFIASAAQYKIIKENHPILAGNSVNNTRAAQYDVYHMSIKAGMPVDKAMDNVRRVGNPEALKDARKKIKSARDEVSSIIRDELIDVGWFSDAHNAVYINDAIEDHITLLVSSESITPEEAVPRATERFKETHRFLSDNGSFSDGVWIDTRGRDIPESMESAWSSMRHTVAEELEGSMYEDSNGYYIQPNPLDLTDRNWQVYGRSSGLPIVNMRINIDKMIANEILKLNKQAKQNALDTYKLNKKVDLYNELRIKER